MIKLSIRRVCHGKEQDPGDWLAELNRRQEEVRETFAQESVRHEQAYLISFSEGAILVYAVEAEDLKRAHHAFQESTLPIDVAHRRAMGEALGDKVPAELLYDCAID